MGNERRNTYHHENALPHKDELKSSQEIPKAISYREIQYNNIKRHSGGFDSEVDSSDWFPNLEDFLIDIYTVYLIQIDKIF